MLHTDKSTLLPKDHLFFKAYILTGPEQLRVSASDVLKMELLNENGVLIKSQYHKIEDGTSEGSFEIPKKVKEGNYYLRAYTRWMLNYGPETFATKSIEINSARDRRSSNEQNNNPAVFPESGNLVAGLTNSVAVSFEKEKPFNINVLDSKGNEVATVKNYGIGIGTFLFRPEVGEQYQLHLGDEKRNIPLPAIQDAGYSLMVNNLATDYLKVRLEASPSLLSTAVFLKGSTKGITYFNKEIAFKEGTITEIDIPKEDLPSGILSLELVDEFDQIWAYRPIFIDKEELKIHVEREMDSPENNMFKVRITDREGNTFQTNLSIGLQAQKRSEKNGLKNNDLNLDKSIRDQRFYNDLMALTRQTSEDIQSGSTTDLPSEIRYTFQDGLEFYGQAYDLDNRLLPDTAIQILISTKDDVVAKQTTTNADGLFNLSGMQLKGEANMVFRTAGEETKTKLVKVIPYEYEIPPLSEKVKGGITNGKSKQMLPKKPAVDFLSTSEKEKLIALEEITLTATKPLRETSPSVYNIEPTRVLHQDAKRPKTIPQLFLGVPGVQVIGLGSLNPQISIPRAARLGPLLWVIDGFPLQQPTSLMDVINLLNFSDIERIELLIGGEASMYGTRAAGGVILIYTRSGSDEEYIGRKAAQLTFQGFHESIDFEEYRASVLKKLKIHEDVPKTLYWNPDLQTNEKGEAFITVPSTAEYDLIEVHANSFTQKGARGSLKTIF